MLRCYLNELIEVAVKFNRVVAIERNNKSHNYKVYIQGLQFKDKYLMLEIYGNGFTIEDACCDFFRKARSGGVLVDIVTNQELQIL